MIWLFTKNMFSPQKYLIELLSSSGFHDIRLTQEGNCIPLRCDSCTPRHGTLQNVQQLRGTSMESGWANVLFSNCYKWCGSAHEAFLRWQRHTDAEWSAVGSAGEVEKEKMALAVQEQSYPRGLCSANWLWWSRSHMQVLKPNKNEYRCTFQNERM
jgi:hypothetical protein